MPAIQLSRRQALTALGAGAIACRPREGTQDSATVPGTIDTIVVVMMENRSFDHILGALKLQEGRTDIDGLTPDMSNPASDGTQVSVNEATTDCVSDPPHSWDSSHTQFSNGTNSGFVTKYQSSNPDAAPGEVMSYQTRTTMPITYALADGSAVPNQWFCSVMGPTWPNRFYGHAGTSDGLQSNQLPDDGTFDFPTVWKKLDEIGVPWSYYYSDLPFIGLLKDHVREETTHTIEQFFLDAERGELPPVCWIDPGFSFNDDHPPHPVGRGQEFIAAVYKALATSPHWESTLFIITYDEHGGFFDHVPPPLTDDDNIADGFDQLGFRIPVLITGPYVKPGASNTIFDNTSWLKYVCERFGITPWTRRIAAANSIAELLDTERMAQGNPLPPITLPTFTFDESGLGEECAGQGVLGPTIPEHEDELAAYIQQNMPELDRRHQAEQIMAFIREKASK